MPRIRVKDTRTGKTGTIDSAEWSPTKYPNLILEKGPPAAVKYLPQLLGGTLGLVGLPLGMGGVGAMGGYGIGHHLRSLLGPKMGYIPTPPAFPTKEEPLAPLTKGVTGELNLGLIKSYMAGLLGQTGYAGAKALLPTLLRPSKSLAEKTTQAVGESERLTSQSELFEKMRTEVPQQFPYGQRRAAQKVVRGVTAEAAQPQLGDPQFTDPQLLQWRRDISGSNVFEKGTMEAEVQQEVQRILSKEIHEGVPKTVTPDRLYSMLQKVKGKMKYIPDYILRLSIVKALFGIGGRVTGD